MILTLALTAWAGIAPPVLGARDAGRPTLSGTPEFLDSSDGFFRVHYTTSGIDAVTGGDDDGDGVPDKVTRALDALVTARALYVDEGWRPLVGDAGVDGSDAIDFYLQQVDINGYAHGVELDGEEGRGGCWIEVSNDASDAGKIFESVVTHELHHCVQYRYTWEGAAWVFEGTATFEQYRAIRDGALSVGLAALYYQRLTQPELPIDSRWDDFEYAAFLFFKFWRELDGADDTRLPALWEALALQPDWRRTLDEHGRAVFGRTLPDLFLEHATWNAFACGRDDGQHYQEDAVGCEWGTSVPVTDVEVDVPFAIDLPDVYSAAYFRVPGEAGQSLEIACDPVPDRASAAVGLVAMEDGARVESASVEASTAESPALRLDGEVVDEALVVVTSNGPGPLTVSCTAARVAPEAGEPGDEPGGGCDTGRSGLGAWWVLGILAMARRGPGVLSGARKRKSWR